MDAFSRLAHLSLLANKRPSTVLESFKKALPFFYKHNSMKKYSLMAADLGTEFMGIFKR